MIILYYFQENKNEKETIKSYLRSYFTDFVWAGTANHGFFLPVYRLQYYRYGMDRNAWL